MMRGQPVIKILVIWSVLHQGLSGIARLTFSQFNLASQNVTRQLAVKRQAVTLTITNDGNNETTFLA